MSLAVGSKHAGQHPRKDRDGRAADHRCPHGVVSGVPGGAAVWSCPDCRPDDCRVCEPRSKKKDKRGTCKEHTA